jgi:PAS domain S-box-containing protein
MLGGEGGQPTEPLGHEVAESKTGGAEQIDDGTKLLTRRLRAALLASLGAVALFALADLRLSLHQIGKVYAIKIVAVVVLAAALWSLRGLRSRSGVIAVALLTALWLFALSSASAIFAREPNTTPLLVITVAFATATLLPWGVSAQLLLVAVAATATVVTVHQVTGTLTSFISYPNVGVAIGLGGSVFVAYQLERARTLLALRFRQRERAEAEVRSLNAELETRVAQRTAELQSLNAELQHEVAARRCTEAELRRSEAAVSALVENTDAGIWSIDRSNNITAFNSVVARRYRQMFGRALAPGEEPPVPPNEPWRELYDRAFRGEHFTVEQEAELDGEQRFFLTSFAPIIAEGTVTGVTVFSADITTRKRAEEAARQHQAALTHVLRLGTMGEMAAGLAHEINQPLGAIANYAQGCSRRLRAGGDPAELLRAVDQIAAEAIRAGEIIRRLRGLIRKEEPCRDWTDLHQIAANALSLLEAETRHHGIVAGVAGEHPRVYADPIQIEQVLLNLLRNGVEAMADRANGRRELAVRFSATGETIEVAVSDTGHGLPAAAQRVFDPFFSTKPGGLGMGLSISRTIIEAHGGRLWATANPDGGTTFRFTLPTAGLPAEEDGEPRMANQNRSLS